MGVMSPEAAKYLEALSVGQVAKITERIKLKDRDTAKHEIFKPLFVDALASTAEAGDEEERMDLFLRALSKTYTLDEIKFIEPQVVRFIDDHPFEKRAKDEGSAANIEIGTIA